MKITSHFTPVTEILVPEIEVVRIYNKPKYTNFVNDYWDERDIESMIRGYDQVKVGKITVKDLAVKLGKSYSSLKNKAWRMGISHGYR